MIGAAPAVAGEALAASVDRDEDSKVIEPPVQSTDYVVLVVDRKESLTAPRRLVQA
jgi:hypothetical protein